MHGHETSQVIESFNLLWLIPFLPLLGAVSNGLAGHWLQKRFGEKAVHTIAVGLPWLSFLVAVVAFFKLRSLPEGALLLDRLWTWVAVGQFHVELAFGMDALSAMMALIVTFVGSLIHVYSIGYMHGDESYFRFFTYLNLFMFAMLTLVLGDNLLLMFVGWEGVGLCSYLLIGFWYRDLNNARAGMKAFVVNRIGDFGFLVGFFILFWGLGGNWGEGGYHLGGQASLAFRELPALVAPLADKLLWGVPLATLVGIFFFVGATGKSAQIPLYVWLPDAMAGPTPVSALIHAATMVTAGVYMVARMNFLYVLSPAAMTVVALTGAATALFAATIGCLQYDIKKVLAYSTVSQLGYMFIGVGVGAFWAGSYHLLTHDFFKACLFLGAGSVILSMHHEQDMRKMGGLGRVMPLTRWTYWVACVAIAGFPIASGFFSKDEILWRAFDSAALLVPGWVPWLLGFVAAGLTSFYMFRSYFMTFTGETVKVHGHEPEEQRPVVTGVLVMLAIGAVMLAFVGLPHLWMHAPPALEHFLAPVFAAAEELPRAGHGHGTEWGLMLASLGVAFLGLGIAWWLYRGRKNPLPDRLRQAFPRLHRVVYNKYYVDEIYQATAVRGFLGLSRMNAWFDVHIIDGLVNGAGTFTRALAWIDGAIDTYLVDGAVNLVADSIRAAGARLRRIQTGRLPAYLGGLLLGGVVLVVISRILIDIYG
ncbi:MAG: NADH-quinone oxidoreductase subunit L [Deltaproteobacteria bacterium]|nr:MAG: NADH-quinone oxidoreductase subunit L [Deltaproteobacteria bacterium]